MTPWQFQLSAVVGLLALAPIGCGSESPSGPPQLRLGRDECRECGMIISEDRCSAALLIERQGRREHVLFDDLGCMLDLERDDLGGATVIVRFVHDHTTRSWIDAPRATFLLADPEKLPTPMSSGMAAFAARDDAEKARTDSGGVLLDYHGLAAARKAWIDRRRGAATRPGG